MNAVPKQISDYMRALQRRSARSRWAGMTPDERTAAMRKVRKHGKRRKPKRHNISHHATAVAGSVHGVVRKGG